MRLLDRRRAPRDAAWLRSEPWTDVELPPAVDTVPTMLSVEERRLLYVLARDYVRGRGAIVDAGCFLGGSTIALAHGVATNRRAGRGSLRIQTYDLFELDPSYKESYPGLVAGIEAGESMRPRFEELLGSLLDHVEVHEGDICAERWTGRPIDLLFIDICKSWAINDHVVREFFPALVPGRGVVIQQDLIHEWLPYLTITMGLFEDSFELIGTVPWCSAVYLLRRAIPASAIPARLDDLSAERKLELFDRGCAPFTGEYRGVIECARAMLYLNVGRRADGLAHLEEVIAAHPDSERVRHVGGQVARYLASQG
jgi:predicted O-methyltransferase YrrM